VRYRVTRDVAAWEDHNYAGRDVRKGELLYKFTGCTYGCIDTYSGVALCEVEGEYPFFEFPWSAIELVNED
jgi:hypothetical protein